jgi:hypothetical protein
MSQATKAPSSRARARLRWIVPVVIALLALYPLAGFYVVPRVARSMAQDYVAKELGRKLVIGAIRFNPFTFEAVIEDLALREADDAPILGFKSLRVNAELASILNRGVVLKNVQLDDPVVKLVINRDGTVNLAQLAPSSPQPKPAAETPPPRVRIARLAVENGRVDLEDRAQPRPVTATIEKIHFDLADFRMDLDYKNAFAFSATTAAEEQFEWTGSFTVQPLGSTGRIAIRNLRALTLDDYLQEYLPFRLAGGVTTLSADYQMALHPKLALDVSVPSITVRDLQLKERVAGAQETPLAIPQLDLSDLAYSYARSELVLKQVAASGARAEVRREKDGSINLTRLFVAQQGARGAATSTPEGAAKEPTAKQPAAKESATKDSAAAASGEATAFKVRIDTIRLADADVRFEDRAVAPSVRVELKPATVTVTNWSTDLAARFGVEGDIAINQSGRLQLKGDAQIQPLATQLDVTLRDLALPFLQPYLAPFTPLALHSARLGVTGKASYAETKGADPAIAFTGNVDLADLRTRIPPATEDLLRWKALNVAGIDYRSAPARLAIDRITVNQLYAQVIIAADRTLNVAQIVRQSGDDAKPAAASAKPAARDAFPIRVRQVRVVDGSANFADHSIEPNFAASIVGLNGGVDGLSSDPASRAKVKLEGKVDKYAPVDIAGELNLLAATKYTDIALNFRNMELTTFNPYSGKFAGYNIVKGKLTTELRYKIDNRALQAEHHVIVDNLVFGDKTDSKDAAPIPVKLAVALLKDRKGIIDLQLPVRGSLDDPEFKLGPIIWKAVLGLLTKIVTAPFAALGSLFGAGEELAYLDFPAGSAALPPSEQAKLDKLASALVERPQLRLDVPQASADRDADALARAALDQRVAPGAAAADPAAAKRVRVTQLENVYKQVAKAAPAYPPALQSSDDVDARLRFIEGAVLEKLKPDKAVLDTLARQRAQAVQDTLLAKKEIEPQRVFVTTDRKAAATPGGAVRMELKLE